MKNNSHGQSVIECAIGLFFICGLLFGAFQIIFLAGQAVVAKRWAADHARCISYGKSESDCSLKTCKQLYQYFSLTRCHVRVDKSQGKISSTVSALLPFLKHLPVSASYSLFPFEYRRVP